MNQCKLTCVTCSSPMGKIQVSGCENGVHNINVQVEGIPADRTEVTPLDCIGCEVSEKLPTDMQLCVEWLQAYFHEPQTTEKLPLPSFHHPILQQETFTSQVLQTLLQNVKLGQTVSYKSLAKMAGNARAVRAVGRAMRRNPVPLLIPCHRVISSSGQSGSYMGGNGNHLKQWLLAHEKLKKEM